jgi:hypothetical protein
LAGILYAIFEFGFAAIRAAALFAIPHWAPLANPTQAGGVLRVNRSVVR